MTDFEIIESEDSFSGRIIRVQKDRMRLPNGAEVTREVVRHPGAAVVVPILDDRRIILIRQFRYPAQKEIWEVPAGTMEPGETPETCALREVEEETGYRAERVEPTLTFYSSPGFCDEKMHLFHALNLTQTTPSLDEDESLQVAIFPIEEALRMAVSGEVEDAKSIIGIYTAASRLGAL